MQPMNGRRTLSRCLAAAALLLAATGTPAQSAAYKCGNGSYSDRPCSGGKVVGGSSARTTDKTRPVPQDRATIARRATLTEEARAECRALDAKKLEQQQALKEKGDAVTLQDEMPLVFTTRRQRELRC